MIKHARSAIPALLLVAIILGALLALTWADDHPEPARWLSYITGVGSLIGTAVTAVATIFLWLVTRTLAQETRRMAELSSQPHVVATVEPNRWSMGFADIHVENTGNATAYGIHIAFDPPVEPSGEGGTVTPLQRVSVLKPGQSIKSFLSDFTPLNGKSYFVTVSWGRTATATKRESHTYTIDMADLEGIYTLGASDPLVDGGGDQEHTRGLALGVARLSQAAPRDLHSWGPRA